MTPYSIIPSAIGLAYYVAPAQNPGAGSSLVATFHPSESKNVTLTQYGVQFGAEFVTNEN